MTLRKVSFEDLYGADAARQTLFAQLAEGLTAPRFFSAPGRVEIGGNHTDHNRGQVLAAAVSLDSVAAAEQISERVIAVHSAGYAPIDVRLDDLAPREEHGSAALVRGLAARFVELGLPLGGLRARVASDVLPGSGLSSSAAFEVLLCAVFEGLYGAALDALTRARVAQWAENNYMGKPCGLMDQTASSVGGMVHIDFGPAEPAVERLDFDFAARGCALVVVAAGSSHDDLTREYAAIPAEMRAVAGALGGRVLYDVSRTQVLDDIRFLRERAGDRAVLRALHFCDENLRVEAMMAALRGGDMGAFFANVIESGESSWKLLQNIYVGGGTDQSLALALELSRRALRGRGAYRVHGGGFAGTMLAFVPEDALEGYIGVMEGVFGAGACRVLGVRGVGACEVAWVEARGRREECLRRPAFLKKAGQKTLEGVLAAGSTTPDGDS